MSSCVPSRLPNNLELPRENEIRLDRLRPSRARAVTALLNSTPRCPAEVKKEIELQIAYVLFVDIVGYSLNEQRRLRGLLNELARGTEQFRTTEEKGRLISLPPRRWNGAGVYQSREAPVECART